MRGRVQRGTATASRRRSASRSPARRHDQRCEGCLVHRLFARSRGRRLSRLRQAASRWASRRPAATLAAPDVPRLHAHGAERQARHAVPRSAGHRNSSRRRRAASADGAPASSSRPSSPAPRRPTAIRLRRRRWRAAGRSVGDGRPAVMDGAAPGGHAGAFAIVLPCRRYGRRPIFTCIQAERRFRAGHARRNQQSSSMTSSSRSGC